MDINILDLNFWKNITIIIGVIVSTSSIFMGVLEYSKDSTLKRANYFLDLHKRANKEEIIKICALCAIDHQDVKQIPYEKRLMVIGFFEEVAIAMNSKLIKKKIVHYMFGYDIIVCWKCDNFWQDIDRENYHWITFHNLVTQMENLDNKKLKRDPLKV